MHAAVPGARQEVFRLAGREQKSESSGSSSSSSQAMYVLPDRHDVPAITSLLEQLDQRQDELDIASYAISDTSLEEVMPMQGTVSSVKIKCGV